MTMENPTIDDIKNLMPTEVACLLGSIGAEVGKAD